MTQRVDGLPVGEDDTAVLDDPIRLFEAGSLLTGEMADSVPVGSGVDLDALLDGDDAPMQVVVEVEAGLSKRGWRYTRNALARYAGEVNSGGLPGYLGHQRPEDIASEFKMPVTHWVGAQETKTGTFRFRGVIDQAAKDLKRLIKAGRVNQVSIFGMPKLATVAGETQVVDATPISIDWTPLKRAGMNTKLLYAGEMADRMLSEGEEPDKTKGVVMNLTELLQKLRELGAGPKVVIEGMGWTAPQIVGEMGDVDLAAIAPVVDKDAWQKHTDAVKAVGELAEFVGLESTASFDEIKTKVETLKKDAGDARTAKFSDRLKSVVGEMVEGDKPQAFVMREASRNETLQSADDDALKKAVGELLEDEFVKSTIDALSGSGGGGFNPKNDDRQKPGELVGASRKRASL